MRIHGTVLAVAIGLAPASNATAKELEYSSKLATGQQAAYETLQAELHIYRQRLRSAYAAAEREEFDVAEQALDAAIAHPLFDLLPRDDQRLALSVAAQVAIGLERYERSRDFSLRAIRAHAGDPDDWYRLSMLESELGNHEVAAAHLVDLVGGWPELLDNLHPPYIFELVNELESTSQSRLDLLQALFDAGWTRKQLGADGLWYHLALMRILRDEPEAARAVIARVAAPLVLVGLRSDRRFDALVDHEAPAFDVERAAVRHMERLRTHAEQEPMRLDIQAELGNAMLTLGMDEAVVKQADVLLAAIADADEDLSSFQSLDDQAWIMNNKAIALRRLGRTDEALEVLRRAALMSEGGQPNVSQALNLGQLYAGLARPEDALRAIAQAGEMSGYGRMVQASVRLHAALQQGDRTGADAALAYMREHRDDSRTHLLEALLATVHLDEAAETLIDMLASTADRADALEWVQEFQAPAPLPGDVDVRTRRRQLLARDDVQQAIDRVGRREHHAVHLVSGTE